MPGTGVNGHALIELRGVHKHYATGDADVHALRGIDLDIAPASSWRSWVPRAPARRR